MPTERTAKGLGGTLLRLAVTAILVGLIFRNIDVSGITARFADQSLPWVFAAACVTALQIPLGALRWRYILASLAVPTRADTVLAVTWIGGFWANCLLGTAAGDAARAVLAPAGSNGRAVIVHSVLFDRAATLAGLVLVIVPVALLDLGPFARSLPLLAALAVALLPVLVFSGIGWFARIARGWRFFMANHLMQMADSWRQLRRSPGVVASALVVSALGQVGISATAYCLARAEHLDTSLIEFLILMPPVVLLTALPISAGGWGLRENAMIAALAPVGIASNAALLISVQMGMLAALTSLPGGVILLFRNSRMSGRWSSRILKSSPQRSAACSSPISD